MKVQELLSKLFNSKCEESKKDRQPLIFIDTNAKIKTANEKVIAAKKEAQEAVSKLEKAYEDAHKSAWREIEDELLNLSLITKEEIEKNVNLEVESGVLFIHR